MSEGVKKKQFRASPNALILRAAGIPEDQLRSLSKEEMAELVTMVNEIIETGDSKTANDMVKSDYKWEPVSMEQFLDDPYYLGDMTSDLFPIWRTALIDIFDGPTPCCEVILGGALGTGKTTMASLGMLYDLYRVGCLRNPHEFYGLMKGANIAFCFYSVSKEQAADSAFGKLVNWVEASPYFRERMPKVGKHTTKAKFKDSPVMVIVGCVAKGTLIETPNGSVSIEDLTEWSPMLLSKEAGHLRTTWRSYGGVVYSGRKDCVTITTEGGKTLTCSLNHKVLVYDLSVNRAFYKRAGEISTDEMVLGLQASEGMGRVPDGSTREANSALLRVHSCEVTNELPSHEGVQGQSPQATGRIQDLSEVQRIEASRGLSAEAISLGEWFKEVFEHLLQGMRSEGTGEPVQGASGALGRYLKEVQVASRTESERSKALAGVLRVESSIYTGSTLITHSTFTIKRSDKSISFSTPRIKRALGSTETGMESEESGEGASCREEVCEDSIGESGTKGGRSTEENTSDVVTGELYCEGLQFCDGVLWRKLRVLWKAPHGVHIYGPRDSGFIERGISTGESCTVLSFMQQQQELAITQRLVRPAHRYEQGCSHEAHQGILPDRVIKVEKVGELETYDIVHVNNVNHSVLTNGIVSSNSTELHAIGKDIFCFLCDEMNYLVSKSGQEDAGRAYAIYNNAKDRLKSRFLDNEGSVPGKVYLVSSKRTHASFLEGHIKASKEDISAGRSKLYEYSQWAVRDPAKYRMKKFRVELGDRVHPARILEKGEDPREGSETITVPGEYLDNFEKDMDGALRNIAGISTDSICPLLQDKSCLYQCIAKDDNGRPQLFHPFTKLELDASTVDDTPISTYFDPSLLFQVRMSTYVPRYCPDAPRYVHVDIAFTEDSMGIACVHQSGIRSVKRSRADGTYYDERVPEITVDFMVRINPPKKGEIDLAKMRAFIISLRDLGLPIKQISFDGYNSKDSAQLLRKLDFNSVVFSIDRTDEAYLTLRQALMEGRIRYYEYEAFIREMSELERDVEKAKVDHPKISSSGLRGGKDVADAVCGASFACMNDLNAGAIGGDGNENNIDRRFKLPTGSTIAWEQLEREANR